MSGVSFPKPYADAVAKLRVPFGFVLIAAFVWFSAPTWTSLAFGLPISMAGLALRGWAAGHLEKNLKLADSGPYAHVRNPLYLGSLLMGLGVAAAAASLWVAVAAVVYFAAFYPAVMREEAAFLGGKFPREFPVWAAEVPPLLPRLTPGGPCASRFQWARVRRNREWRTALALPFVFGLLWARGLYRP